MDKHGAVARKATPTPMNVTSVAATTSAATRVERVFREEKPGHLAYGRRPAGADGPERPVHGGGAHRAYGVAVAGTLLE